MLQWAFGCCKLHSDQCLQQRSQPRQRHTGVNWPQPGKVREQTLRTWQADRSTLAQCVRGVLTNPRKMPPGAEEEGFQSAELCRAAGHRRRIGALLAMAITSALFAAFAFAERLGRELNEAVPVATLRGSQAAVVTFQFH